MEYEIADAPQMGEDDCYEPVERRDFSRAPFPRSHVPAATQRDRAVAIPEQEADS
jgi:hypothetical protein